MAEAVSAIRTTNILIIRPHKNHKIKGPVWYGLHDFFAHNRLNSYNKMNGMREMVAIKTVPTSR